MPTSPAAVPHPYSGDGSLAEAYRMGWQHGHGLACHNVPRAGDKIARDVDWTELGSVVTPENARDYHELLCFTAEAYSRCYSPFEFTAYVLDNPAEFVGLPEEECEDGTVSAELWEAFDAGVAAAIAADVATYTAEDYGFDNSDNDD